MRGTTHQFCHKRRSGLTFRHFQVRYRIRRGATTNQMRKCHSINRIYNNSMMSWSQALKSPKRWTSLTTCHCKVTGNPPPPTFLLCCNQWKWRTPSSWKRKRKRSFSREKVRRQHLEPISRRSIELRNLLRRKTPLPKWINRNKVHWIRDRRRLLSNNRMIHPSRFLSRHYPYWISHYLLIDLIIRTSRGRERGLLITTQRWPKAK